MSLNLPDPWLGGDLAQPLDDEDLAVLVRQLKERLAGVQRNFDALSTVFPLGPQHLQNGWFSGRDGTNRKQNVGTATLTWPGGSSTSDSIVVPHGLGAVPVGVLLTPQDQDGTGIVSVTVIEGTKTASNFTIRGLAPSGFMPANTATTVVAWHAWT